MDKADTNNLEHSHNHSLLVEQSGWRLLVTILLNFIITIAEIIGGILSGSLTHLVQKYLIWSSQSKSTTWIRRIAGVFVLLGGVHFIYTTF